MMNVSVCGVELHLFTDVPVTIVLVRRLRITTKLCTSRVISIYIDTASHSRCVHIKPHLYLFIYRRQGQLNIHWPHLDLS